MVLIDTSVWINFLSKKPQIDTEKFEQLLKGGLVVTCKPVVAEILSGQMTDVTRNITGRTLNALTPIDVDWNDPAIWKEMIDLAKWGYKNKLPLPGLVDRMILVCALHAVAKIWTKDKKLNHFAESKGINWD